MQLFSRETLERLSERAGFSIPKKLLLSGIYKKKKHNEDGSISESSEQASESTFELALQNKYKHLLKLSGPGSPKAG